MSRNAGEERSAEPPPQDVFHVQRDEAYLKLLQQEAEFWDNRTEMLAGAGFPAAQRYLNERMTGDPDREWFQTISDHGPFRNGCILGASNGHVETELLSKNPDLHLTIYDISADALARLHARLEAEYPGRSDVRNQDLNFISLPAATYDLFIAEAAIHHLVNLEHVACQINQSLNADGLFFMLEVVSESKFQFSERKKRLFQALMNAIDEDSRRAGPIDWPDPDRWSLFSPFECARSGEILDIFARHLEPVSTRTAWALAELMLFTGRWDLPPANGYRLPGLRKLRRAAAALRKKLRRPPDLDSPEARAKGELLFELDAIACDTGYLQPGLAFVTYRKRAAEPAT